MEKLLGKMGINGKLRANFGAIVILAQIGRAHV